MCCHAMQAELLSRVTAVQQAAMAPASTAGSGLLSSVFGRGPAPVDGYAADAATDAMSIQVRL